MGIKIKFNMLSRALRGLVSYKTVLLEARDLDIEVNELRKQLRECETRKSNGFH